jgi:hypothetical protein
MEVVEIHARRGRGTHASRHGFIGTLAVLLSLTVALAYGASSAAAETAALRGTFTVQFPKGHTASNAPCPPEVFCGVGSLAGFGQATISILEEEFNEIEGSSCFAVTREEQIELRSGDGSLVIDASGTFCRPGGSGESHASPSSYGGPGRFRLSFTIDEIASTGVFANATGTGTEVMDVNGGIGVWHLSGALN